MGLAVLGLLTGCSSEGLNHRPAEADALHRAVQATLASKSFVARTRISDEPDFEFVEVYQAPDRLRETIGDNEKITIGRDRWAGPGPVATDGTYVHTTLQPADRRDTFERMLTDLRGLAAATDVSRDGATYSFRFGADGKVLSGTATLTGGRIGTLAIGRGLGNGWATQTVISDYDQAPAVDPPPAEKVLDQDALRRGTIDPAIANLLAD